MVRCGLVGTILIAKSPFSDRTCARSEQLCDRMKFELLYGPKGTSNPVFRAVVFDPKPEKFLSHFRLDISPTH